MRRFSLIRNDVEILILLPERTKETALDAAVSALITTSASEIVPSADVPSDAPSVLLCVDSAERGDELPSSADRCLATLTPYLEILLASDPAEGGYLPPPLVLTEAPNAFRASGFDLPAEFIFSLRRQDPEKLFSRLHSLGWLWAGKRPAMETSGHSWASRHHSRFHVDLLRDFVIGQFRSQLGLDKSHHDARSPLQKALRVLSNRHSSEEILKEVLSEDWAGFFMRIKKLYENRESLLSVIFAETLCGLVSRAMEVERALQARLADGPGGFANLVQACVAFEVAIPVKSGSISCNMPAVPPTVLLIDDRAEDVQREIIDAHQVYPTEPARTRFLSELLPEIIAMPARMPNSFEELERNLVDFLGAPPHAIELCDLRVKERADLILLDLSLLEKESEELGGLQLLRILRSRLPTVPLLIFSSFENLRHVIQAVREGASWYCRKSDPGSLLRSLEEVTGNPSWARKWERIASNVTFEGTKNWSGQPIGSYLITAVSGLEEGGALKVEELSGGIGGAETLQVSVRSDRNTGSSGGKSIVVKIDEPFRMLTERQRYQRYVRPFIPNRVGRIDQPLVRAGRRYGAIAYSYAGLFSGGGGHRRTIEIKTLGDYLQRELDDCASQGVPPFASVLPLFEELFNESLAVLHRQGPSGPRSDWRELLFGECRSLRETAELRLPVDAEIDLQEIAKAEEDSPGLVDCPEAGERIRIRICHVEDVGDTSVTVIAEGGKGRRPQSWRFKLVGDLAQALAEHRGLRPLQHLQVVGRVRRTRADALSEFEGKLRSEGRYFRSYESGLEGQPAGAARARRRPPRGEIWERVLGLSPTFKESPVALGDEVPLFPFHASRLERVLSLLGVAQDLTGIIHGDLNLGNVLFELDRARGPLPHPWLIDFARARRDAIAHDFVELETDLVTRLLRPDHLGVPDGIPLVARARDFLEIFDRPALAPVAVTRQDHRREFLFEAVAYVRRKAVEAGVLSLDYQALLYVYYLIVLKIQIGEERRGEEKLRKAKQDLEDATRERKSGKELKGMRAKVARAEEELRLAPWRQVLCTLGGMNAYRFLRAARIRLSISIAVRLVVESSKEAVLYLLRLNPSRRQEGVLTYTPFARTVGVDGPLPEAMAQSLSAAGARPEKDGRLRFRDLEVFGLPAVEESYISEGEDLRAVAFAALLREIKGSPKARRPGLGVSAERVSEPNHVFSYDVSDRPGAEGQLTRRITTVYEVTLPGGMLGNLQQYRKAGGQLLLVKEEDIQAGRVKSAHGSGRQFAIGANSRIILKPK